MTYLEKLRKEHPEVPEYNATEGAVCPCDYGYETSEECPDPKMACVTCWDREVSEEIVDKLNAVGNPNPIAPEEIRKVLSGPHILDSGNRRAFPSGAVRDIEEGKGRMDLLPWAAIMEVSKHCENGAIKYGEHNVDKGIPTHSLCDSAARHLAKYLDGWDDEPHLLAAAWNLLWALQMEIKNPECVDTPWKNNKEE